MSGYTVEKTLATGAIWIVSAILGVFLVIAVFAGIQRTRVETWCAPDQIQWQVVGDFDQRGCVSMEQAVIRNLK